MIVRRIEPVSVRRARWIGFVALIAACLPATESSRAGIHAAEAQPNILLIVADDLGYADVGFMGCQEIKTPHLDKLAKSGTILDSFYVQPVCSPTRAALMTGRYAVHTSVYTIVRPHAEWGLPLAERTLAVALSEAGYETAICGKWHLGEYRAEYRPTQRGFQHQYGQWFGAIDYNTHLRDGVVDWHRNDEPSSDEGYATHLLAREACQRIRQKAAGKPLFLYLPFNAVHSPFQVPESYVEPYDNLSGVRKTYAGMVAAMDQAIGQVIAALEEAELAKNTLIVFCSDNGGPSPGRVTDNGPLRAGKGTIYEGGIRVCACVAWPGKVPAGAVVHEPLHAVDWYPTLVKLAGGKLDTESQLPLDGLDIWPTITQGAKSPHDALLMCGTRPEQMAVRMGDWKLLLRANDAAGEGEPSQAKAPAKQAKSKAKSQARKKQNQQTAGAEDAVQLFNLAEDLGEQRNLASAHPDKVQQLRQRLDQLRANAVPPGNP